MTGAGTAAGFIATFPAVLAFSIVLAAPCLFSLSRVARVAAAGTPWGEPA